MDLKTAKTEKKQVYRLWIGKIGLIIAVIAIFSFCLMVHNNLSKIEEQKSHKENKINEIALMYQEANSAIKRIDEFRKQIDSGSLAPDLHSQIDNIIISDAFKETIEKIVRAKFDQFDKREVKIEILRL